MSKNFGSTVDFEKHCRGNATETWNDAKLKSGVSKAAGSQIYLPTIASGNASRRTRIVAGLPVARWDTLRNLASRRTTVWRIRRDFYWETSAPRRRNISAPLLRRHLVARRLVRTEIHIRKSARDREIIDLTKRVSLSTRQEDYWTLIFRSAKIRLK